MDENYLVDLNKLNAYIDISSCFEYQHPMDGMNMLYTLLEYVSKNLDTFDFDDINKTIFYSFMQKFKANKDLLCEQNKYLLSATNKLKFNKGLPESDWAKVSLPQEAFYITLKELILFYRVLATLQDCYEDIIIENSILSWNIGSYFRNTEALKTMLEKRLMNELVWYF